MTTKESERSSPPEPSSSITTSCSNKIFMELPSDIHCEILSRVNSSSLFSCRAVCKAFLDILSTRYFIKLSHSRGIPILLTQYKDRTHFRFVYPIPWNQSSSFTSSTKKLFFPDLGYETRKMLNSVDGIICLCFDVIKKPVYALWNPALQQYALLPKIQELDEECTYLGYSAFGSCRRRELHKIIRLESYKGKPVIRVLTLGTGTWRLIEEGVKAPLPDWAFESFVNGALHWINADGIKDRIDELIYSFDVEKETFKTIPPPLHLDIEYLKKVSGVRLGVTNGVLHLMVQEQTKLQIWAMSDYGIEESWTRKSPVDLDLQVSDQLKGISAIFYKPSFVPLQDFTKDQQLPVEVKTYARRRDD